MMSKYWVVTPYNSTLKDIFEKAWEYDLNNETIAVGWVEMGDVSKLDKRDFEVKFKKVYSGRIAKNTMTKILSKQNVTV